MPFDEIRTSADWLPPETITTNRLWIIPLDEEQLGWYADDPKRLADRFGYQTHETIADFFRVIIRNQRLKLRADSKRWLWLTFWLIVDRQTGEQVGSIDYKNIPDMTGTVEIGYGIDKKQENKGYATEAVNAIVVHAFSSGIVRRVIAETESGNKASERVLRKAGFRIYDAESPSRWWKIGIDE